MMLHCSVPRIPVRWRRACFALSAIAAVGIAGLLARAASDPVMDLKAGATAFDAKRYSAAITALDGLAKRLPKLADYAAWFLASAQYESKNYAAVPKTLDAVWAQSPPSPLVARAALLAAHAFLDNDQPKAALDVLRAHSAVLPQPQGDLAMAVAFAAADDGVSAAVYYQRVYYGFPLSAEATQAGLESERLRAALRDGYPPAMPAAMLGRAQKLLQGKQTARAEKEFTDIVSRMGGTDRDLARVGIGAARYVANQNAAAYSYLSTLDVSAPEADAQRMYYQMEAARRLDKLDEMDALANRIGRLYPTSPWHLEAAISAANRHLVDNDTDKYEPLYRACYVNFPKDSRAGTCHWKAAWVHYLHRLPDAGDMLREQLRMFPSSDDASAALYFLGRLAQQSRDNASARAYYEEVSREYPNQYYATQARERLAEVRAAQPAAAVSDFLRTVSFPQRSRTRVFEPNAAALIRIERARLLVSAGLPDWAERELRFGAQTEDQPHILAMELGKLTGSDKPQQAIKYVKGLAPGYLFLPIDSAPLDFWRQAFPLPYRADLERYSQQNKVDPFLMAALIRQESEFDEKAVSVADARGLTQIKPSTGRELSQRLKMRPYTTAKLFQPTVNLALGTYYFKLMTDSLNGNTEAALAAYNAGLSRARAWLKWGDFREPAEFQ